MTRWILYGGMIALTAGCATSHCYEVDLSHVKDLDWDGKITIEEFDRGLFVGWKTEEVLLSSSDGLAFVLNTQHSGKPKITLVGDPAIHKPDRVTIRSESNNLFHVKSQDTKRLQYHLEQANQNPATTQPSGK